jgi:hypothetical protein
VDPARTPGRIYRLATIVQIDRKIKLLQNVHISQQQSESRRDARDP